MTDVTMIKDAEEDRIGKDIVDASVFVHRELGPGLLESVYEACLFEELKDRGLKVSRQSPVPVIFKNKKLDEGFRLDLLVEDTVIIELKTVETILPVHEAQILSYMKMTGKRLGYLINFNEALVKNGLRRFVRRKAALASQRLGG